MFAKAVTRYIRMTPRKLGYVAQPLRRRSVAEALVLLSVINRRAAKPVAKTIRSAFANAKVKDPLLGEEDLVITRLTADEGPTWKRFRAAAFGRAVGLLKRTAHLTVELERKDGTKS